MPVFLPWPAEAYQPYYEIRQHQKDIEDMIRLCLEEGKRHIEVPEALYPLIKTRALEISKQANKIIELRPNKVGGPPKWHKIAEQVEELASDIVLIVSDDLRPALKRNDMVLIFDALKGIKLQNDDILAALKSIPRPKPDDSEALKQAAEIVNREFER